MPDRPALPCPICGKPASPAQTPFCGTRCADVDLGRWLTGQYRAPGPSAEGDQDGDPLDPSHHAGVWRPGA